MIRRNWNNISLISRTAILMVIPLIITITIFGYFVTVDKIDSSEKNVKQRGGLLVRHYASVMELSVIAQDKLALFSYADLMLKEQGVVSVVIQDIYENVLVFREKKLSQKHDIQTRFMSSPVYLSGVTVGSMDELTDAAELNVGNEIIGLVRVGMFSENAQVERNEILLIGFISTTIGILLSMLIAWRLSRVITQPVLKLNDTVKLLTEGRLSARVREESSGEVGALEKGINQMAVSLSGVQAQLFERVERATNELNSTVIKLETQNVQLEKSRHKAEQLGNAKSQFLACMSHELRTPLNAVIGFSRLIGQNVNDQKKHEYAKTIISSATQLNSIIDDVLTFSKLQSGSLILNFSRFNPLLICEDVVAMLSEKANAKSIELVLHVNNDVPDTMKGDTVRISQVITNLINNAIKFTDNGIILIEVGCDSGSFGEQLSISITDTGCGISPECIDTIFSEFSQIDNILTRQADGVGLGLSISKHLSNLMGGDVFVKSVLNVGSCFTFMIPMLKPVSHASPVGDGCLMAGNQVLLFDAVPESANALIAMLESFHVDVTHIENRLQFDLYLQNNALAAIDAFVLSLSSQVVSDVTSEKYLSTIQSDINAPVIVLSTMQCEGDQNNSRQLNGHISLTKPVRYQTMFSTLCKIGGSDNNIKPEVLCGVHDNGRTCEKNITVLLVEDNSFNQKLMKILLQQRGLKVKVVDNCEGALNVVSSSHVDLILMDLHLPETDGISIARSIGALDKAESIPVVLVTADVLFDTKDLINEGIINQVLYKPVCENALDLILQEYCQGVEEGNVRGDIARDDGDKGQNPGENNITDINVLQINANMNITQDLKNEILRLCDLMVNNEDNSKLQKISHQLKGIVGYYQLDSFANEMDVLHTIIKSEKIDSISLQLDKIIKLTMDIKI